MKLSIDEALQRGVAAHKEGKLQNAERLYRAILQSKPTHPDANHNLGVLAVSLDKVEVALPLFKKAIETNPTIEQFWLSYIDALVKGRHFDTARQVLNKAKEQGINKRKLEVFEVGLPKIRQADSFTKTPLTKNQTLNSAIPSEEEMNNLLKHYQNREFDDGEKLALSLTLRFPGYQPVWTLLGAILKAANRTEEAIAAGEKAVQLGPSDAIAHYNLGAMLGELKRFDSSEAAYRKAISLNPNFVEAQFNLGNVLKESGRLKEAEESYRQSIALKPGYAEAYNNLGSTLQGLKNFKEAEASYKQSIELDSGYGQAHHNLASLLRDLGRLGEAAHIYLESIPQRLEKPNALELDYVKSLFNLAIIQDYMNDLNAAVLSLERVIEIDPNNYGLRAKVHLAIHKFLRGNFAASKKYLSLASAIQEKSTEAFWTEKIFQGYVLKILSYHGDEYFFDFNRDASDILYIIGDSHSLAGHGLRVSYSGRELLCKSKLIMGCKQWHLGNSRKNQFKEKFEKVLFSLPKSSQVLLTIGEIDCRLDEGLMKHKIDYPEKNLKSLIEVTIENYLQYVVEANTDCHHHIIIQGIPCPNVLIRKIPKEDYAELVQMIKAVNFQMEKMTKAKGFGFLDVHTLTDRGDGFSNSVWHIDSIHLSPNGFLEAWRRYLYDKGKEGNSCSPEDFTKAIDRVEKFSGNVEEIENRKYLKSRGPSEEEMNNLLKHYQNREFDDGEKLALSLTLRFPGYQPVWTLLGAILKAANRTEEAIAAGEKAVQLGPSDAIAHYNLGAMLGELKRFDSSEAAYRKAISLNPNFVEAQFNLGNVLKESGRLKEAEESYRQSIALKPGYAEAYNNLGSTLQGLKNFKEAEASFRKAILIKADYVEAYCNLGNTFQELGRLKEAEEVYRQSIALKKDYAEAHNKLGKALMRGGRHKEALNELMIGSGFISFNLRSGFLIV